MPTHHVDVSFSERVDEAHQASIEAWVSRMEDAKLPPILNAQHLSMLSGISLHFIFGVSNSQSSFYRTFKVRKRSGGFRRIDAPLPSLLKLQRWILDEILDHCKIHSAAKAYKTGLSIKDAARLHRNQKSLMLLDIREFFPSISEYQVFKVFKSFGYPIAVSTILSKICTLHGSLPQGAPTSGALSNAILYSFDEEILSKCKERGLRYSRYADDVQVSGESLEPSSIIQLIQEHLAPLKLKINNSKTRLLKQHNRQIVTGIVVNKRLSAPRSTLRRLRQACYYISKFGAYGHARYIGSNNPKLEMDRLIGQLSHAIFINPKDKDLVSMRKDMLDIKQQAFGL